MQARADGACNVIDAHRRAGFGARRSSSVHATRQSHQTIHFCSDFEAKKARWAATLDGARVAFEVGRSAYSRNDAVTPACEKPLRREMYGLFRSPCGRFTLASWWQNGSNAPEGASFEFD
jgi:hypothetical protein